MHYAKGVIYIRKLFHCTIVVEMLWFNSMKKNAIKTNETITNKKWMVDDCSGYEANWKSKRMFFLTAERSSFTKS